MNEDKLMKTFGKRVAVVRKSKGVTQQQLAESIGMSVVAIAYIETGKRWARLGTRETWFGLRVPLSIHGVCGVIEIVS